MSKLGDLYGEIYDLTNGLCRQCTPSFNCCAEPGCNQAKNWAAVIHEITLPEVGEPPTPYLSHYGCVVPIHMRPVCTMFLCPEAKAKAPQRYMELRAEIAKEEAKRWKITSKTNPNP